MDGTDGPEPDGTDGPESAGADGSESAGADGPESADTDGAEPTGRVDVTEPATATERTVRVMTFNVRVETARDDGERDWDRRKDRVASVLRFHRPDVVGLQEPLGHQFDYLRERVPGYEWVGGGRVDGDEEGEYTPVGYRSRRFDRRTDGTFWLSESPDVPGSVGWDAAYPRIVTWVRLVDRRTDRPWYLFNTHFDHVGADARLESARLLRERVASNAGGTPAVVLGDFNCGPTDPPYAALTAAAGDEPGRALTDARAAASFPHHGPTVTFDRFEGPPDRKIDHVFVAGPVAVRQHGILADHWDGQVPSDHAPVVADVLLDGDRDAPNPGDADR